MPKPLTNVYPKLRANMAEKNDTVRVLSEILSVSNDTVRKSLRGERDFLLPEARTLSQRYGQPIEILFEPDPPHHDTA